MISGFYEMKQHEACLGLEEQGRRWWSQSWGYQEIGAQGDVSTPREAAQRGGHTLAPPSTLRFPVGLPSAKPRLEPDGKVTQQMACAGITRESRIWYLKARRITAHIWWLGNTEFQGLVRHKTLSLKGFLSYTADTTMMPVSPSAYAVRHKPVPPIVSSCYMR